MSRPPSRRLLRRRPLVLLHVLLILGLLAGCRQMAERPWNEDLAFDGPVGWQAKLDRAARIEPHDILWVTATRAGAEAGQPADLKGRYLVEPDGAIRLGRFGNAYVGGKSLAAARRAVEHHLRRQIDEPAVTLVPVELNSPYYYVVTQEAGLGDKVKRVPLNPGDTVLDAISQVRGLSHLSSTDIWIARHGPGDGSPTEQILRIDWDGITRGSVTATNYALLPGDRIYIAENEVVGINNFKGHVPTPLDRFREGVTSHAASTIRYIEAVCRNDD